MSDGSGFSGPRHTWRQELVRTTLQRVAPEGPYLDVGCGDGGVARRLRRDGHVVVALDADLRGPIRARRGDQRCTPEPDWVVADATRLPLTGRCVAAVVMGEVLEHVADDGAAVAEVYRVLARGGHVVASAPAGPDRYGDVDLWVGHARRYRRSELRRLFVARGFAIEDMRGWGFPFGRLYDRLIQRPAFRMRRQGMGWLAVRAARLSWLHKLWLWLFAIDELLPAGNRGSGWLVVARKKRPPRASGREEC